MRDYSPIFTYTHIKQHEIKPIAVYAWHELGLGDSMSLSPIIRKLSNIYDEKITLFWPTPKFNLVKDFYKNNPYIEKIIRVGDTEGEESFDALVKKYDRYVVFNNEWIDYSLSDLRQMAASKVGFTLKDEEMNMDYIPDEYIKIENLPEKYVCINPYIAGVDRTWEKEKWQDLVNRLNNDGVYVVAIGKGVPNIDYYNLDIKLGVDLCNQECQNNLSQTWHILNKSDFFVTFDCGMYIFAGTTDTYIIQLGWYSDPFYHAPIRKGVRYYKYDNIKGDCDVYCDSEAKFNVKEFGTMREKHMVQYCFLDRNWICKPPSERVYNKIKELYV